MSKRSYYKTMFLIGGIWNIGGAVPAWLSAILMPQKAFALAGMSPPEVLFAYHAMYAFIITYGIGYIIVSRNIEKNHGIVVLGIIGKTFYFAICASAFASGAVNFSVLQVGLIDMVFVILFAEFLISVRKAVRIC